MLSEDGTLKGNYLSTEHSGTYQCLVRDQTTGIEVFSRRVQVAVTGKIANLKNEDMIGVLAIEIYAIAN